MVFPDSLGIIFSAVEIWEVILRDTNNGLDSKENVRDESENSVRRNEVCSTVVNFVVFDHDKSGQECEDGGAVQDCMDVRASALLLWGMRGWQDEEGVGGVEDARSSVELWGLSASLTWS